MYNCPTKECRISVLVEPKDGEHFYRTWTGRKAKAIHKKRAKPTASSIQGAV